MAMQPILHSRQTIYFPPSTPCFPSPLHPHRHLAKLESPLFASMPPISYPLSAFRKSKPPLTRALKVLSMEQPPQTVADLGHPPGFDRVGRFLNASSRWIVVAIVIAVVAWRHDNQVVWAVTGGILNAGNSKLLKKVFNQERPTTALGLKADPGMPSSHAMSLGYLGLYAAIALILSQGVHILIVAAAIMILLCAAYLAWLRISQGLHTPAQVIVGAGFGCGMAGLWIAVWHLFVHEAVTSSVAFRYSLYCVFSVAVICFVGLECRKWLFQHA